MPPCSSGRMLNSVFLWIAFPSINAYFTQSGTPIKQNTWETDNLLISDQTMLCHVKRLLGNMKKEERNKRDYLRTSCIRNCFEYFK